MRGRVAFVANDGVIGRRTVVYAKTSGTEEWSVEAEDASGAEASEVTSDTDVVEKLPLFDAAVAADGG